MQPKIFNTNKQMNQKYPTEYKIKDYIINGGKHHETTVSVILQL
jgi:hypothetical protein